MRLRRRSGFEVAPSAITLRGINILMTRNSVMTTDGIAELVRELRDEKKKLHPDQE
jgi:hypothetical protein